jgi:hypothetical protein
MATSAPATSDLPSLIAFVESELFAEVIARVTSLAPAEPAYCVALLDMKGKLGLPVLGVGLQSEREAWLADLEGKSETFVKQCRVLTRVGQTIWNPMKFANSSRTRPALKLAGKPLVEGVRGLQNAYYESGGRTEPTHKVFARVGARLDAHDWSSVMRITDDFVAYYAHSSGIEADMPRSTAGRPIRGALAPPR